MPELDINIVAVDGRKVWPLFAPHHYLTSKYSGHGAFMAVLPDGTPVAFTSFIAFPHGKIKNAKREHRTVVLPDFQGLGIGARLSDWLAEYLVNEKGHRYYSRTSHPRLGAYRDAHPGWRAAAGSRRVITQDIIDRQVVAGKSTLQANPVRSVGRDCWSHEYVGKADRLLDAADVPPHLEAVDAAVREMTSPPSFAPADTLPAPLADEDPVAAYIARTADLDALRDAYRRSFPAPWKPEHVEMVRSRA